MIKHPEVLEGLLTVEEAKRKSLGLWLDMGLSQGPEQGLWETAGWGMVYK